MIFKNTNIPPENNASDAVRNDKHCNTPSNHLAKQSAAPNTLFVQLKSNHDASRNKTASHYPTNSTAPSPPNLNLECNETLEPFINNQINKNKVDAMLQQDLLCEEQLVLPEPELTPYQHILNRFSLILNAYQNSNNQLSKSNWQMAQQNIKLHDQITRLRTYLKK